LRETTPAKEEAPAETAAAKKIEAPPIVGEVEPSLFQRLAGAAREK
jgi:hypothetical protein